MGYPVADGIHRLIWLVLRLPGEREEHRGKLCGGQDSCLCGGQKRNELNEEVIEYNVKRAKRNGLMPPTFIKLKSEHPDIYFLFPREIVQRYRSTTGN